MTRSQTSSLPSNTAGRNVANRLCGVMGILALAAVAPICVVQIMVRGQDARLDAQSLARCRAVRQEAAGIRARTLQASASIRAAHTVAARLAEVPLSRLLAELVNAMPSGVSLVELEFDTGNSDTGRITLGGFAESQEALNGLSQTLHGGTLFKTVRLFDNDQRHNDERLSDRVPIQFHLAVAVEAESSEPPLASNDLPGNVVETR